MKSAFLKLYTRRGQIYGSDRIKLLSQMRQGWNNQNEQTEPRYHRSAREF